MEAIWQDIRYSMRILTKNPAFALVTILTLALGIGATTAIFSMVEALLLRSLPYANPERLVLVWGTRQAESVSEQPASYQDFVDLKQRARSLEAVAAASTRWISNLSGVKEPKQAGKMFVSAGLFGALGVTPQVGRDFLPSDDRSGAEPLVILSHGLWQRHFAFDRSILGKPLALDGNAFKIIGVMPPGFQFMEEADVWVPLVFNPLPSRGRAVRFLNVVARLLPQTSLQQAEAELAVTARSLAE